MLLEMLYLHWNAQEPQGVKPGPHRGPLSGPLDHTPQGSRTLRASIFCTLRKRFLINGAPSHPLPTGTLEQSYATVSSWVRVKIKSKWNIVGRGLHRCTLDLSMTVPAWCTYDLQPCFWTLLVRMSIWVRKSIEEIFILKPCSWGRNHFIHPWSKQFFTFFYGPYHSKFWLNNNIGYRYIHEGVVGKLYMLSTQYFLSIKIVTSSNYLPKKNLIGCWKSTRLMSYVNHFWNET